jgi:hypothetical protein
MDNLGWKFPLEFERKLRLYVNQAARMSAELLDSKKLVKKDVIFPFDHMEKVSQKERAERRDILLKKKQITFDKKE